MHDCSGHLSVTGVCVCVCLSPDSGIGINIMKTYRLISEKLGMNVMALKTSLSL